MQFLNPLSSLPSEVLLSRNGRFRIVLATAIISIFASLSPLPAQGQDAVRKVVARASSGEFAIVGYGMHCKYGLAKEDLGSTPAGRVGSPESAPTGDNRGGPVSRTPDTDIPRRSSRAVPDEYESDDQMPRISPAPDALPPGCRCDPRDEAGNRLVRAGQTVGLPSTCCGGNKGSTHHRW